MKSGQTLAVVAAVILIALGLYFVNIEQTADGSLPEGNLPLTGGSLPDLETETGDIAAGRQGVTSDVSTIETASPENENPSVETN